MDSIALWFASTLGQYVSKEVVIFIISMIPILELRGGLLVAWSLGVPILKAIPICIIGNIIPIPFILLFIRKIFQWMKKLPLKSLVKWRVLQPMPLINLMQQLMRLLRIRQRG